VGARTRDCPKDSRAAGQGSRAPEGRHPSARSHL
jgi:hypothetical protein